MFSFVVGEKNNYTVEPFYNGHPGAQLTGHSCRKVAVVGRF